ncbi:hypothetical protein LIER_26184 [Lithospermum erythrorhizon]|uniref:Integrase catalytic domain-containing protein n=1 Tax=Lithospermum erythrorhizon TaxID=34254 RepID=A0AAV3R7H5_LITER
MNVAFTKDGCVISNKYDRAIMKGIKSPDNCFLWTPHRAMSYRTKKDVEMWYRKLGHTNYRNIQQYISKKAVRGLPKLDFKEKIYGECQVGKHTKVSHQWFQQVVTIRVLELLHMDLIGPMQVESIGGKEYIYVCVDDFSRYTWVEFTREKSDQLIIQLQREKRLTIIRIRSDHGKEFENSKFNEIL